MNYNEWDEVISGSSSNDIVDIEFKEVISNIKLIYNTGIYLGNDMKIGACATDINHIITNWGNTINKKGDLEELKKLISVYDLD